MSAGGAAYVYGLSAKGVDHALRNGYSTLGDEDPRRAFAPHAGPRAGDHVVPYRAPPALRSRKGSGTLWRQTDLKHTVHPDALFYVADPATPGKAFCYFLEIERAKLGNYRNGEPQILRKLRKYYDYFNSTDCEKEWGFRQYRVIVVQRTTPGGRDSSRHCGRTCSHRMFWLTTETAYREDIGGAIFMTPKDDAPVAFSFLTR